MKFKKSITSVAIIFALATPAYAQTSTEMYYIFDIKTDAPRQEVSEAIRKGLKKYASKMQTTNPIVMGKPPVEPKQFEIVDMSSQLGGGNLGGLMEMARMQSGGLVFKTAKCDGAIWTGNITRDISTQTLRMNLCLFPYQGGYSLNVYGQDTHKKVKGRGLSGAIGGMIAQEVVEGALGGPAKWTQRAFRNMRKKVYEDVGVVPVLKEGQPIIDFTFKDEPTFAEAPEETSTTIEPAIQVPVVETSARPQLINSTPDTPQAVAPAPSVDCTGLSDDQCMAKLRESSQ